jgi:hypothetical protein
MNEELEYRKMINCTTRQHMKNTGKYNNIFKKNRADWKIQ